MAKQIISTVNAPIPKGPYSQGVRVGDLLFVSAQGPFDPKTGKVSGNDIESQTRQTLQNIKTIVEASGFSLNDIVRVTVFLRYSSDFQKMNEVYSTIFSESAPARTTVEASVPMPDVLIAADAIAGH